MKRSTLRLLLKILLVVLLITAGVSVGGIVYTLNQYNSSIKEYANLEQYVSVEEVPVAVEADKQAEVQDATETEDADTEVPEEIEEPVKPKMINVNFDMDFEALKAKNSDLIGWIYYEPLELSYPVVKDRGNDYYEHYSFEQEKNVAGAIFLDYLCKPNLDSFNSIVYGHNMRNGTMFGSLNSVLLDTTIIENNPYFYIFTEEDAYMYKIVSAYYTPASSQTYKLDLDYTLDTKKDYVKYMESVSEYKDTEFFDTEIDDETRICTLSTCHGLHSTTRTVIHGVLVAKEPRNEEK